MDLSDIDQWSRALLQNEARKRGIRSPEMYSRPELIKLILRHDYGSGKTVREAAKLVGGILGSAKQALRAGLELAEARIERATSSPPTAAARAPAASTYVSPWDEPAAPEPVAKPEPRAEPESAAPLQPAAADPAGYEQLSYEPQPDAGLLLRWRVGSDAIHRARAVLGAHGELALRVITVRVEDGLYVRTETRDHGPIDHTGDWTAPLEPSARYVSSVGLRSGERFVSIVHAAS